jgi:hypothetical protein
VDQLSGVGKETPFLRHLYIKCIILPRQARDKHREKHSKNGGAFPYIGGFDMIMMSFGSGAVHRTPFLEPFIQFFNAKNDQLICQARLGTQDKETLKPEALPGNQDLPWRTTHQQHWRSLVG